MNSKNRVFSCNTEFTSCNTFSIRNVKGSWDFYLTILTLFLAVLSLCLTVMTFLLRINSFIFLNSTFISRNSKIISHNSKLQEKTHNCEIKKSQLPFSMFVLNYFYGRFYHIL